MNIRTINYLLVFVTLLLPARLCAQEYVPDDKGCKVDFHVTNHKKGEQVIRGSLHDVKGKIVFDPKHLNTASFDITVAPGSVNTGVAEIDKALKNQTYFNPAKYTTIRIKSTSVNQDGSGGPVYMLHGDLTMKGITKPVNIQFMVWPAGAGYKFRGSLELSRQAFGIGNKDDGIDDHVSVFIEVKANKAAGH